MTPRSAAGTSMTYTAIHNSASQTDALVSVSSAAARAAELLEIVPVNSGAARRMPPASAGGTAAMVTHPIQAIAVAHLKVMSR